MSEEEDCGRADQPEFDFRGGVEYWQGNGTEWVRASQPGDQS